MGVGELEVFLEQGRDDHGDFKGEEGQGREGFRCFQPVLKAPSGHQGGDSFGEEQAVCEGQLSAGNTATGALVARDDVCDPLALRAGAFSLGAPEDEFIARIQGCRRDDDDGGGTRPNEDEGRIPRGGVQSGGGGAPAEATGAGLVAAGLTWRQHSASGSRGFAAAAERSGLDSGGPIFFRNQAMGVISGNITFASGNQDAIYSHIGEVEFQTPVEVKTSG